MPGQRPSAYWVNNPWVWDAPWQLRQALKYVGHRLPRDPDDEFRRLQAAFYAKPRRIARDRTRQLERILCEGHHRMGYHIPDWTAFYNYWAPHIEMEVRAFLSSHADVEDCIQETFLGILKHERDGTLRKDELPGLIRIIAARAAGKIVENNIKHHALSLDAVPNLEDHIVKNF